MNNFFLTTESIPLLAKLLLSVIISGYIGIFIKKNRTTIWFFGYIIGYTLLDLFAFLGMTFETDWATLTYPMQFVSSIIMSFSYLRFAYLFNEELFAKEQRWVHRFTIIVSVLALLFLMYEMVLIGYGDYLIVQALLPVPFGFLLWATVVFYRKYRSTRIHHPENKYLLSAYFSFFVLTVLANILSLAPVLNALNMIPRVLYSLMFFVLNLFILAGLFVSFINYLAQKTTVLVKLIGLSLVLFSIVIGLQGYIMGPENPSVNNAPVSPEILQQVHDQVEPFVWFLFASVVVIIVVFPIFYSRSVLAPLNDLLSGVDKVNAGDLDISIPVQNQDEIGYVTGHFNEMTASLRKAHNELQEYALKLETKVEKRTHKLNEQNELLEQVNGKLREQTETLEKMSRIRTRLFMNISHELRTPITLIAGPLQKLLTGNHSATEIERHLKISIRNTERLQQLVEQILDLNRLESNQLSLKTKKTEVTSHVAMLGASFQSMIEFNELRFNQEIPTTDLWLYLDHDKFEKIITNLISNALKFTPKGGSISLSIQELETDVAIRVSDTGVGISPERLPLIFERFNTSAHNNVDYREGMGIGLTLSKEYAELHGGAITVHSTEGIGSSFTVMFPKGTSHLKPEQILEEVSSSPYTLPKTDRMKSSSPTNKIELSNEFPQLLLVEDNQDMAIYVCEILQNEGYRVEHTFNGKEALKKLATITPDLIISDVMMPVMDGMTFLKELRNTNRLATIPTIFLSARSDLEGKLESFRLGVNDYLVKPFNASELIARIENLLEYHQSRKQAAIELSDEEGIPVDQELINTLTRLIEEQIGNIHLTVEQLAGDMAMSRRTLYREIKRTSGFSAAAFVREVRLQKARQKLESGFVRSISELADEVGFQSPGYFSKVYSKRFGKRPQHYLKS